jgi:hypothetical protein
MRTIPLGQGSEADSAQATCCRRAVGYRLDRPHRTTPALVSRIHIHIDGTGHVYKMGRSNTVMESHGARRRFSPV